MTAQELSKLFYLKKEIALDRQRLLELEAKALPGAQVMSGLPGSANVSDRLGNLAAEIADLRLTIEQKFRRCVQEQRRLEQYIADIDDSFIRLVFICRFAEGLSWQQVANKLGGHNTADGLRMISKRFLLKH